MIKFVGRYADLKSLGFRYQLLFDNVACYTTFDTGNRSDVWIQKRHGGMLWFDGYDLDQSAAVLNHLVQNDFNPATMGECNYNTETQKIEKINWILYWGTEAETNPDMAMQSARYRITHREINIRQDTFETLKNLWQAGMLQIL